RAAGEARGLPRRHPPVRARAPLDARHRGRGVAQAARHPRCARAPPATLRGAGAQVSSARRADAPLAAGLVVAAYAAALRPYGIFDYVDEGLLLVQALRAARGQVPYVDFHTGYGPLYFRLQAWLLAAGGWAAIRWALVAVQGAAGALLFVLARRLAGPALAWAAVALEVAFFLPVAPGRGAPFNAPYPAWYAGLAGVALAVLLGGEAPARPWRAAVAGVIAGVVAAMKPNSGLLLAAGAAAAVVLGEVRDGGGGWVARTALALVALALWSALAELRRGGDAALLAPSALAAMATLQLYPRPDFVHLMPLGVLLLPLVLRVWARFPLPRRALIALPLLVAAARSAPTGLVLGRLASGRVTHVALGATDLVIDPARAEPLRAIARAAAAVRAVAPEESVLAFPACGIVLFVAERSPAGPHDYFFPGRPDRAEADALATRLAAA